MNQNRTVFDIDEETDAFYLQKAAEYHEWLIQQEAQPRLTRTPIFRDREDAERRLRADYFDDHCKYPLYYFRRRFRMSRKLFLKIVNGISSYTANPLPQHFHFFTSRLDCTGRMSISALMKCTAAIRQMAYGSTPDAFDEYLQMSEHTAQDALFFFNMCIIELYMPKYLRKPTSEDVVKIQQKHNNVHCFPGMLGSINCMHWEWKNCRVSWQDDLAPVVPYVVNGVEYRNGYYLADGIYPEWASFVKSYTVATYPKHTYFKQRQESARKDVESAFGVLQGRWGLIQQPARAYEVNTLRRIMYAGIIMHNMILEDQNMSVVDFKHVYSNPARSMQIMWIDRCETQRRKAKELRDRDTHISLQQNLMNHIWREVEEASEED
ncbi:ALP1-like protein [Tanacetum coccineum]